MLYQVGKLLAFVLLIPNNDIYVHAIDPEKNDMFMLVINIQ
jgi:hypothetical protein